MPGLKLYDMVRLGEGGLTGEVVRLTLLRSLVSLEVLLPLSFYFAIMIGMGRAVGETMIVVMAAGLAAGKTGRSAGFGHRGGNILRSLAGARKEDAVGGGDADLYPLAVKLTKQRARICELFG